MTINLTLPPEIEERIGNIAEAHKMTVEEYILSLIDGSAPRLVRAPLADESREDFRAAMLSLSRIKTPASLSEETWDRAAIYGDNA